jgi:hypothetical protein
LQQRRRVSLAELRKPDVDRSRVVGVDGQPRVDLLGIRRSGNTAPIFRGQRLAKAETDDESATGFEEIAANYAAHATPAMAREARWIALMTRGYVPQRHRWPFMAVRICASVGCGTFESSSEALMIIPLKQ